MISLMLFTALPAATAAQPQHVVPMWMHGRHPAVEVRLAGRGDPLRFVVDSAAGATVVDSRIARGYGLEEPPADDAGIMVQGAADNSSRLQPVRETEWSLGTLTLKQAALHTDLSALGTPEAPVDGLIGNDFTARWDTRWDFAGNRLELWVPGALGSAPHCQDNAIAVRDETIEYFAFVRMRLGGSGVEAVAVVDTGAAQTVLNLAAAEALGLRTDGSDPRVVPRANGTRGLGAAAHASWLTTLPGLETTGWRHGGLEVRISDLPVFRAIGLAERPALILGIDAMAGSLLDIGANADRICLRAAAAG